MGDNLLNRSPRRNELKEIAQGVFAETDYIGCNNSCIVTDEGLVLVDPPMCPSKAVAWKKRTSELGDLRYVINTEHHWDHIGGNCFYPDARVISHSKTREGAIEGFAAFEFWYNRMQTLDPEGLDLLKDYEVWTFSRIMKSGFPN
jgi:glyoxylase-like metal-dependent hydrolase (beta-lactamase superfamily II)